jgi:hypothetical protein
MGFALTNLGLAILNQILLFDSSRITGSHALTAYSLLPIFRLDN